VLKQKQFQPLSVAEQVITMIAATKGALDHLTNKDVESAVTRVIAEVKKSEKTIYASLDKGTKPEEADVDKVVKIAEKVTKSFGSDKVKKD